jgi:hypothetical protein
MYGRGTAWHTSERGSFQGDNREEKNGSRIGGGVDSEYYSFPSSLMEYTSLHHVPMNPLAGGTRSDDQAGLLQRMKR